MQSVQIDKVYEPQRFEPVWAQWWVDSGLYGVDANKGGKTFSLVVPPPNVTGVLHMGHMLDQSEMDVVVRWHRMRGFNTLWLPGTDHAGIATQMVVERHLGAQGIDRRTIGREEFVKRVWQWKEESGGTIKKQMVRLGASCDWSRERFTLDPGLSQAVRETFVRLHEKGLIYQGEYMVNWCPRCRTAISDLETVHEDTNGHLWHIEYPVAGTDAKLVVATTRPETMLGDTAVALNPSDPRYTALHGKSVVLPLMNREIPIVLDEMADPKFGTGVVKVTPAHDPNDFEAGRRHNLPFIRVIGEDGLMTAAAGPYAGLDRFEARKRVLADLEAAGLLRKTEDHHLSIGRCQRCQTVVEPLVSKQWFVRTKPLAEPAIRVVEDGRLQFVPENWTKTYFEWMRNIRDWCISRQLWWGHRIPAWHCADCGGVTVARVDPTQCAHCSSARIEQDPDVLDTWFSSGLWPFSTLGWPDQTQDLAAFYPTTLLITGYDILFFWVARMIMLGIECTGDVPFRAVHMHGMVRDAERQKMSKTKGNVVDPLVITDQYGTDAVRLTLLTGAAPGQDIAFTPDRLQESRNFANKIWNASRLIFMAMERSEVEPWLPRELDCCLPEADAESLLIPLEDRWIFSRVNRCADQVNRAIQQYRFHEAGHTLYHFFWNEFCDWYLELKKLQLEPGTGQNAHWRNLLTVYEMSLRLLHPVMPFLTEELWQRLAKDAQDRPVSISLANYPQYNPDASDFAAEREMELLQEIVGSARKVRADLNVDAVTIVPRTTARDIVVAHLASIERLSRLKITISENVVEGIKHSNPEFDLIAQLSEKESTAQRGRVQKEIDKLEKVIANSKRQLGDAEFTSRAPGHVIDGIRSKLDDYEAQLRKHKESIGA